MSENKDNKVSSTYDIADVLIFLGEVGSKLKLLNDVDLSTIKKLMAELENLEVLSRIVEHKEYLEKEYKKLTPEAELKPSEEDLSAFEALLLDAELKPSEEDLSALEALLLDRDVFPRRKDIADFIVEATSLDIEPSVILGHRPRNNMIQWIFKRITKSDVLNIQKSLSKLSEKKPEKENNSSLHGWFKEIRKM